jgi:hypothetical protein
VLIYGNRYLLENDAIIADIRKEFPYDHLVLDQVQAKSWELMSMTIQSVLQH